MPLGHEEMLILILFKYNCDLFKSWGATKQFSGDHVRRSGRY